MKAIASTGVSYIRDDLNAGSWLHINALIRLPTPGIEIIPNVRYARRRDSLHHRIRRPTLFEMCGEPKPVVTSVRCYAPDRNTQYRQKLQNLHNVQSFLRRSFRDGAIFYLLGRAISGDSQDFGDGGWRKNLGVVFERFLGEKQGQFRLPDHGAGEIQGFLVGNRKKSLKGRHGNLLSVRLNAEMKGDYSQPGLMLGYCSEQIDVPSAYLVYAVGSRLRRQVQRSAGRRAPFSYRLISAPILDDLAEIMVFIALNGSVNRNFIRLDSVFTGFATAFRSPANSTQFRSDLKITSGRSLHNEEPNYGYKLLPQFARASGSSGSARRRKMNIGGS